MANTADIVNDILIKHDIDLLRVDAGIRKKVEGVLNGLSNKLRNRLTRFDPSRTRPALMNKKLNQLVFVATDDMKRAYDLITETVVGDLSDLAVAEGKTVTDTINRALRVDLSTNQVHLAKLKALAGNTMIEGAPIKEWWARQTPNLQRAFKDEIREGMLSGETIDDMVRRVRGTRANKFKDGLISGQATNAARRMVRSSVLAVANNARMETYKVNSDVIKGVQWVSTLDERTSDICIALDGQAWTLDGKKMRGTTQNWRGPPPAHWNCRSTIIPITKTFTDLARERGLKKKLNSLDNATKSKIRAATDGKTAASINYEGWLKKQPVSYQKEVLGNTKYRLWKEKKINFRDLIDQNHNPLSVAQLVNKFDIDEAQTAVKAWTASEYNFAKKVLDESKDKAYPTDYIYNTLKEKGFIPEQDFVRVLPVLNKDLKLAVSKYLTEDKALKKFTHAPVKKIINDLIDGKASQTEGYKSKVLRSGILFKDVYMDPRLHGEVRQTAITRFNEYLDDVLNKFHKTNGTLDKAAINAYLEGGIPTKAIKKVKPKPKPKPKPKSKPEAVIPLDKPATKSASPTIFPENKGGPKVSKYVKDNGFKKVYSFVPNANLEVMHVLEKLPADQRFQFQKFISDKKIKSVFSSNTKHTFSNANPKNEFALENVCLVLLENTFSNANPKNEFGKYLGRHPKNIPVKMYYKETGVKGYTNRVWNHVVTKITPATDFSDVKLLDLQDAIWKTLEKAKIAGNKRRQFSFSTEAERTYGGSHQQFMTWIHELGHQFHYWVGKRPVPSQFADTEFSNKFKSMTDYGSEIGAEWHAEHFVAWLLNRKALASWDKDIAEYFDELVDSAVKAKDKDIPSYLFQG